MNTQTPRPEPGILYRHYKPQGDLYEVICISCNCENPDLETVIYRSTTTGRIWDRPMSSWQQQPSPGVDRYARV